MSAEPVTAAQFEGRDLLALKAAAWRVHASDLPARADRRLLVEAAPYMLLEIDRLTAEVAALYLVVQGRDDALDRTITQATTTAAGNDLIRRDRDTIRDAAMNREAALIRLADDLRGRGLVEVADELTALLTGGQR